MTPGAKPLDLVQAHLRAEDVRDVDAILATFADDCVYRIPAYGVDLRGKAAIGDYYRSMFTSFPDFTNTSEIYHVCSDAVFVEITTERSHHGEWNSLSPTGRSFATSSLAYFPVVEGGLLGGEIVYVNSADALYKAGALPSADLFDIAARLRGPLAGRVALVTGASRGIGRAIAVGLAGAGAQVAAVGRDDAALDALAAEVEGADGLKTIVADVTQHDAAAAIVARTLERFGRLDVLVNSAGGTRRGPALDMTDEAWNDVMSLNLTSVFRTCVAAARVMDERGGAIINIASLNGVVGNAWAAGYAASKGGLVQLTKSLALEWASRGIRVNAIGPGFVETDMTAALFTDQSRAPRLLDHIPMGRFGTPQDMQGAAVFLASDASSYLTGQVIYVDGGYLCV